MNNLKKLVGIEAAKFVKAGMVVGLGTGPTAAFFEATLLSAATMSGCVSRAVLTHDSRVSVSAAATPVNNIWIKNNTAIILFLNRPSTSDQDILFYANGSLIMNMLPSPSLLSAVTLPPCASTTAFVIASPIPSPPLDLARDLSVL